MPLLTDIAAVTLDVGGTLIEPWPSVGHVYAEVAGQHGHKDLPPEQLNEQFAAAWRGKRDFNHSRINWFGLVQRTFAGLLLESEAAELFDDLYARFAQAMAWRVFDDVVPTLTRLRQRSFRLGVISNWDERLRPLLDECQLRSYFQVVTVSIETGAAKPAPEIFRAASAALSLPAGSILHVGDSRSEDWEGARSAGYQALLLDRKAALAAGPSVITTLAELERFLGKSRGESSE